MKCPHCKDGVLEEDQELTLKCSKCRATFCLSSTPVPQDNNESTTDLSSLDSNIVVNNKADSSAVDGDGQRKRKSEVPEEKPAKRQSICIEDKPDSPEGADTAASELQKLSLVKKAGEQQVEGPVDTAITEHEEHDEPLTINSVDSEQTPEVRTSDQSAATISKDVEKEVTENAGTAFQESSGPDVKKGCETVTLLKKSEGFDAPVDPGPNAVKEEADKVGRESKESNNNTPSEEPEGDDQINNDHGEGSDESDENESDLEEDNSNPQKDKAAQSAVTKRKLPLSRSQKKKEKKKERKKRKEEEGRREAAQKSLTQSDNHNQVADKGKGGRFGTNQPGDGDDYEQTHNNEENDFGGKNSENRAKNNQTSSEMKKEYLD